MKVLVLGGTRFIGRATVERLIAGGHDVTISHRGGGDDDAPAGVSHIHGDRARLDDAAPAFARLAPDVAIDMAAMTGRDALAVSRVLRGVTSRAVCISSMDVYRAYGRLHGSEPGPIEPSPLTEESPLRAKLHPYRGERRGGDLNDYDKIPVERAYLDEPALHATVLRLSAVHGERDYQRRLFMEVARMDDGRPAIIVPASAAGWRWSRAYAGNVADAIVLAGTDARAASRIYNVAEPAAPSQVEWLRRVARVAGWRGEIVPMPDDLLPQHLRTPNNYAQDIAADSSAIRRDLGYAERVPPDEGIARAIEWERAQPRRPNPKSLDYAAEDVALEAMGWRRS